ncbi:transcription termination/antitermination protein NusA, partial [Campylobacter sp. CH185]
LAPAIVNSVKIEDKKAIVSLNSEQKSKAIGKNGINIRLASMLSGYEIELNELSSSQLNNAISNEEAMKNLQDLFKI